MKYHIDRVKLYRAMRVLGWDHLELARHSGVRKGTVRYLLGVGLGADEESEWKGTWEQTVVALADALGVTLGSIILRD